MKKKYIITGLTAAMVIMAVGCGKKADTILATPLVPATEISTETIPVIGSEGETEDELETYSTLGIYKSSETSTSANGPYDLATFTDANGNDFVATISEDTITPEEFIVGNTYNVTHSNIMTMSLPGIYPQVYSIEESDMQLSSEAVVGQEAINTEFETGYAESENGAE